jgi:hypothetical protein
VEVLFTLVLNYLPSHTVESAEPPQPSFAPSDYGQVSLAGGNLTKLTIGKVHYNDCFVKYTQND